jgi:hypothetical protein
MAPRSCLFLYHLIIWHVQAQAFAGSNTAVHVRRRASLAVEQQAHILAPSSQLSDSRRCV